MIAMYNLGICYIYGICVCKNDEIAFEYFKRAAYREYLHGITMLGYCYRQGIGTRIDKRKAFELLKLVINHN